MNMRFGVCCATVMLAVILTGCGAAAYGPVYRDDGTDPVTLAMVSPDTTEEWSSAEESAEAEETMGADESAAPETVQTETEDAAPQTEAVTEAEPPAPRKDTLTFSFVGDVLLAAENGDDGFWSFNLFAYDTPKTYYFEKMQDIFGSDDFTVANCENVFTDQELEKIDSDSEYGYWYYSGTENAGIYPAGSIEVVSTANNHAMDYGIAGRNDTIAALESVGCTVGREGKGIILEKNGFRVGLLCVSLYSEYWVEPVLAWLDEVKGETDYRIVYYHGGSERVHEPDAWRVRASHAMIDAGADLVLGNHPHVLQPEETYQGKKIIYSLGNFLFGGSHTC